MSIRAIDWAFEQQGIRSTDKLVLISLADYAGDAGLAYPSIETLETKTCLDRKTIIAALDRLQLCKLIADTGKRVGVTQRVKVYRIEAAREDTQPNRERYQKRNSSENGPLNSTVFPGNSSENGTQNRTEPSVQSKNKKKLSALERFNNGEALWM